MASINQETTKGKSEQAAVAGGGRERQGINNKNGGAKTMIAATESIIHIMSEYEN
jgi:hypothetical protein